MIDRLKKAFSIANKNYIEALKFIKLIGIWLLKVAWAICPPLILIDPLWFFAIPIIGYWWIFWVSYFWEDWIGPRPTPLM